MYIKHLNKREHTAYSCIEYLGLEKVVIPYFRNGDILKSMQGMQITHSDIQFSALYNDCLKHFYKVESNHFSPGIYSFYGNGDIPKEGEYYRDYLLHQVQSFVEPAKSQVDTVLDTFEKIFLSGIRKYGDKLNYIHNFSLLHGDLYSQNILCYGKRYYLIDFEYLRFGPPAIEIAFLVCWDSFCGECPIPEQGKFNLELISLRKEGFLSEDEFIIICYIFIPMFAYLAQAACKTGKFRQPHKILANLSKLSKIWNIET